MAVITRRRLTLALGGAVIAWPHALRAQQPRVKVIGFLHSTEADLDQRLSAFRQGLDEARIAEGVSLAIEVADQRDRLPELAADLLRRGVAVIVVNGVSLSAAMAATSTVPIVFVGGIDPVAHRFVNALNRPDGNVTGISFNDIGLTSKRMQFLHELLPVSTVIAVLLDSKGPAFEAQLQDSDAAARKLGRKTVVVKAASEDELDTAFTTILREGAGAVFVGSSALLRGQRRKLVSFAAEHALPASYRGREFVELGGLMSYGASATDAYRRAGAYVGRILKGAKPSQLPVELSSKFELLINLATAKALRLNVPRHLLAEAAELIE